MNAPLYDPELQRLAVSLPFDGRLASPMVSIEKRAPVCGSRIILGLDVDHQGRVTALGMQVRACLHGQASAAVMRDHAIGRSAEELAAARDQLKEWLGGERQALPDLLRFELFAPALPRRGMHAAILLPFEAAAEAAALAARSAAA